MTENPYQLSDKASKLLNRKAIRRFDKAKRDCNLLHVDELNVIKVLTALYKDLAADNKKAFFDLAVMAYQDAQPHGKKEPDMSWILALLDSYDPVYLVVYTHEVERKRDRLIEGVIATSSKTVEFRRGLSLWSRFTGHELDRVTDEATLKAFRDAGVKKVRWRTEDDDKVCPVCGPRDKKVYPINKVPDKPHINCRCWLEAVKE
ncbi:hypothetical protein D1641_09515 [Colidextribacter sp. OB.20]|uniref:hypothetical protein n=1 Tax=Colidextribacter sp. OB.20 TaxID=2304568 RepID=UPI00136E194E|nr:hypothetical protein [Colidextribacter sp. OB.20]NBI10245.1 hypothetical protein [Colidextribacter sp. OB.20]